MIKAGHDPARAGLQAGRVCCAGSKAAAASTSGRNRPTLFHGLLMNASREPPATLSKTGKDCQPEDAEKTACNPDEAWQNAAAASEGMRSKAAIGGASSLPPASCWILQRANISSGGFTAEAARACLLPTCFAGEGPYTFLGRVFCSLAILSSSDFAFFFRPSSPASEAGFKQSRASW